ncbi:MAG: hypothetical protein Q9164_007775, partial [Protoblastenia rupestris]
MSQLQSVEVAEMEPLEAKELFMKYSKLKAVSQETEEEVDAIVGELGCLALAITLAGSYVLTTPRLSSDIRRYLPEYHQRRQILLNQKPLKLVHQYGESILTTWETSMTAVASQTPEACPILTLLAFLHFDDIFLDLFIQSETDETREHQDAEKHKALLQSIILSAKPFDIYMVEAVFRTLQSYSLVQWKQDQNSYSMHKLVHAWTYARLDRKQRHSFAIVALQLLAHIVSSSKLDPAYKTRLIPHLMANFAIISDIYHEMGRDGEFILGTLHKI